MKRKKATATRKRDSGRRSGMLNSESAKLPYAERGSLSLTDTFAVGSITLALIGHGGATDAPSFYVDSALCDFRGCRARATHASPFLGATGAVCRAHLYFLLDLGRKLRIGGTNEQ